MKSCMFTVTTPPEIYTLSLHDALPISRSFDNARSITSVSARGAPIMSNVSGAMIGGGSVRCRSEEHTSELQSLRHLVCLLLLEKKKYAEILYAQHRAEWLIQCAETKLS